jgi:deazaflavin-dependent oxidoreductase (nitroreductase family)
VAPPRPFTIKAVSALHRVAYRLTRGRLGRNLGPHPILLLTTSGRRSGRPHTVPLLYLRVDGDLAVIASFAGHPRHPDWYLNLLAEPRARVQLDGAQFAVNSRVATPEERPRLWALALAEYAGYAGYQDRTDRAIPVVLLHRS